MNTTHHKVSILSMLILTSFSSNSSAAGFAIAEQGVKGLGSAFSGGAASADDAATIWFNPAGMTQFSGTHVSSALHVILPDGEFNNSASTTHPALGGQALSGRDRNSARNALVPNFYVTHSLNDRMVVGLGINAPFGLVTDHDDDFIGRYHALRSEVTTVNLNPAFAYKVNNKLSIGFGLSLQYIDVKLSNAVDMTGTCLSLAGAGRIPIANCAATGLSDPLNIGSVATDSKAELEGNDWSWGYNLGFTYEPTPDIRFGFHYRSKVSHDVTGDANFIHSHPGATTLAAGLSAVGQPLLSDQSLSASLSLPESVSISAFHQVTPIWSIQTDLTWTKWRSFDELRISFPSRPDAVTPEQWQNTLRYAVGTNYKVNNKLQLRGGLAFEQTPIPSAALRTPRIADENRVWVAVGGTYNITDHTSVDLGYTHIFLETPEIDYTTGPHATPEAGALPESILVGDYDASVDIISVQLNVAF